MINQSPISIVVIYNQSSSFLPDYQWFNNKLIAISKNSLSTYSFGEIKLDIAITGDIPNKSYGILSNSYHFGEYEFTILDDFFEDVENPSQEELDMLKLVYPNFDGKIYNAY